MKKYNKTEKLKVLENMITYLMMRAKSKKDENFPLKGLYKYLNSMLNLIRE